MQDIIMDIYLTRCIWGYLETNMFVLQKGNHMLVVDPVADKSMLEKICTADSVTVILTHEHFDHITGLNELRRAVHCRVIASESCSARIQDIRTNMSAYADVLAELSEKPLKEVFEPFVCNKADTVFNNEYFFDWLGQRVKIISTPGHSAGSSCILCGDMLFAGDTILDNNLMTRFPGSSKKLYREKAIPQLKMLLKVANSVYPGHGDVMSRDEAIKIINKNDIE